MTYFIETYGCEMNLAESASVENILSSRRWTKADNPQVADLVIINTCSVRATAETRIFGRLGFFTGLKKVRAMEKDAKVKSDEMKAAVDFVKEHGKVPLTLIVMGCMAERLLKTLQKDWPCIDYVVGTFAKNKFGDIITDIEEGREPVQIEEEPVYVFAETSYEEGAFSTFVPIMHGCNNFCSYCIVPYVRGRETSRPLNEILHEIEVLSARGVKEITLLGQNVNSYNSDGLTFPALLKKISSYLDEIKSSIRWIRFESSNPKDFSDELIKVIAEDPHVCKGIHVAVQHGSTKVLKAMNRKYTREQYLELVSKIKAAVPEAALSTDLMLGFPGETEEDFEQVLSLLKEVQYSSAFMYYYNPREGTPAAKMDNQIPLEIKKERLQKVIDLQLKIQSQVMQRRIGKTVTVLCDIISRDNRSELLGKTSLNERVAFTAKPSLIGHFATVRIDSLNGNTFRGTLVE
ncbi:tRNA-2-methylthio-N6-dimethylallyladenosine synthase [Treponema rectale]|uniref:tRNA-2-methylthio-N(6)-dimethylallyladenosine synthase n=1 Tax=Treponema rectale TaxID=744512 RepID=A0A840SJ41_9SPIR|nr:tRNA (N6-isopentenyl adenosine(37)-C2)-methylthiotransferase MiaB [Treponema rectale]MBB5219513.1 tRNA-2-methylthio-N6-dimethylallyladenosine synthase [Treponema rectale]